MKEQQTTLLTAYKLMCTAKAMSTLYEQERAITSKYVHATSRGHEAIQLAMGMQLTAEDYAAPYYRDDSLLLGMGMTPYELMLQLLAKKDDPFSGGRTYYAHPSLKREGITKIPHQSSATGMQAIPSTGVAMGIHYLEQLNKQPLKGDPVVVCSLGDASITEGEVAEALQMAVLKKLPILYLIQDNEWDISASADEIRAMDASFYAKGFKGLEVREVNGSDFIASYDALTEVMQTIRKERRPFLVHAKVPLLNHHTSGVRQEWYRDDLEEHNSRDPFPLFQEQLKQVGIKQKELQEIEVQAQQEVLDAFNRAQQAEEPTPESLTNHIFAPTALTEEVGEREPQNGELTLMVDCALHAMEELMREHEECLLYGQDVGLRLGGVFREAATLADKFGSERVFNTPIQEAFIIGSTVGMSAVGCKPIVEVQFADYLWPGMNQLFTEVSRSCYLSNGKWPVSSVIRVPIGAYGSGGPYHSSSIESVLANIRGIKVAYPSNGADLKGLLKAAYYDPNPVVILEHKGLYWSKIPGTESAKCIEPSADYRVPFGKGRTVIPAEQQHLSSGNSLVVITYGMGVHWTKTAIQEHPGKVEIFDLRTINPLDEQGILERVRQHGKALIVTEEPVENSFAQALAGRIQAACFHQLDAAVEVVGAVNTPAIPLNSTLEQTALPNAQKVEIKIREMLEN